VTDAVQLPIETLFQRLAAELAILSAHVADVEDATLGLSQLSSNAERGRTTIHLQRLDTISQSLIALRLFLTKLEPGETDDGLIRIEPAISEMHLADMALRILRGLDAVPTPISEPEFF